MSIKNRNIEYLNSGYSISLNWLEHYHEFQLVMPDHSLVSKYVASGKEQAYLEAISSRYGCQVVRWNSIPYEF